MTDVQDRDSRLAQQEKVIAALENQLRDANRVLAMLVAAGFVQQSKVEQAREIVSTLKD